MTDRAVHCFGSRPVCTSSVLSRRRGDRPESGGALPFIPIRTSEANLGGAGLHWHAEENERSTADRQLGAERLAR